MKPLKVKMILPSLTEADSPFWRPIKYSLFPPIGLATLAAYFDPEDEIQLQDQHVEELELDDHPDLVLIQVYITNAYRSYQLADYYRNRGSYVVLGGLHVTSVPHEAALHADTLILGPAEEAFRRFLIDFRCGNAGKMYTSLIRTLDDLPPLRRDLIKRNNYLVPNSLVVSRGCPHHCNFCYKDSFFSGGKSFYTRKIDDALAEIDRLPGRHLYFLDDHLLGSPGFASGLFDGMSGMNRVFQSAATVESILKGNLIEKAAEAGLRSVFVGFETLSSKNLEQSNKVQNLQKDYTAAIKRLHSLGIMINGSFVFGLDDDEEDVFMKTVDWGVENSITTATYHVLTPYPGTRLFKDMQKAGRIQTYNWDLYDTRNVVYKPGKLTPEQLKSGYDLAYESFYSWSNIIKSGFGHDSLIHNLKHFFYTSGWKKFEPLWNFIIKSKHLNDMLPLLEKILCETDKSNQANTQLQNSTNIQILNV